MAMGRWLMAAMLPSVLCRICKDTADPNHCPDWAASGECESNSGYMHIHCRHSCKICEPFDVMTLWEDVDKDKSGTLSLKELTDRMVHTYEVRDRQHQAMRTPEDEGKLPSPDDKAEKADFEMMDVDKNGFLNSNETLAKHEGEEEEDEEFRNDEFAAEFMAIDKQMEQLMFTQADANHDGLLSPQEYVNYRHSEKLDSPAMKTLMHKQTVLEAKQQFAEFDTNKSGELEEDEVMEAVHDKHLADLTHPDDLKEEL